MVDPLQVSLGETLLEAEGIEDLDTPVNCFRKLFGNSRVNPAPPPQLQA